MKYLPDENKVKVKGFNSGLLQPSEELFDPKDIEKFKLVTLNPTIGYKTLVTCEESRAFGTENISTWHDRKLFDSMVHRKKKARGKPKK